MAKIDKPSGCPAFTRPAVKTLTMKYDNVNYSDYAAYLTELLGRKPGIIELISFEDNQNLMLINRRLLKNNAYHISFINGIAVPFVTDGIIEGGLIQLHSREAGHRFYSVMFEEKDAVEEHYLILDASVESVMIGGLRATLVQSVQLITIEDLVQRYNPIMYNLA